MDFQYRIRELREKKGYTRRQLAEKLGVSKSAVKLWEGGFRHPRKKILPAICELFGVSAAYLIKGSGEQEQEIKAAVIPERPAPPLAKLGEEAERLEKVLYCLAQDFIRLDSGGRQAVLNVCATVKHTCIKNGTFLRKPRYICETNIRAATAEDYKGEDKNSVEPPKTSPRHSQETIKRRND